MSPVDGGDDEPKSERFNMFISKSEMAAIDEWRFTNRIGSRSEAVRRLCKIALALDGARNDFGDVMIAKAEAESRVYEIAMAHIWQGISGVVEQQNTSELLDAIEIYLQAERSFISSLTSIFDEINFLTLADNPFLDADKRIEEKAKVLAALEKVLASDEQGDHE